MNTTARSPIATGLTTAFNAQFAAVTLAALMTLGTLGSIHMLSVSDTSAGTLARATAVSDQA